MPILSETETAHVKSRARQRIADSPDARIAGNRSRRQKGDARGAVRSRRHATPVPGGTREATIASGFRERTFKPFTLPQPSTTRDGLR